MPFPQITALLQQTIGFDVAAVGHSLIERAVKQRLSMNGLQSIWQYVDLLQRSESELQNLVEAVVIPETFFFRYPETFAALQRVVGEQFLFETRKLRVLSVPCSTGEEPFSIAMSFIDMGLFEEKFQIDAIDISEPALRIARLSIFGSNSFRGSELNFRDRYFRQTGAGFQLCDRLRQCVQFQQGNMLEKDFRFGSEPYDFIFCRNLLIYFDIGAQDRALKSVRRLLNSDGLLFVGPAETGLLTQHGFTSKRLPMAFAFQKSESLVFPTPPRQRRRKVLSLAEAPRVAADLKPALSIVRQGGPIGAKQENKREPDLTFAEHLADKGRLGEAAEICDVSIEKEGPSARAFYLLGLIRDCTGDQPQASELYRKALYLEPDHYDALIHLALLKAKSGDVAAAKALKNRARRTLARIK